MRRPRLSLAQGHPLLSGAAAALTLAVLVAACSSGSTASSGGGLTSGSSTSGGKSAYVIGSIIDLTGNDATSGAAQQAGMGYFLQQLNASGGVNGHPLKVLFCEVGSTPMGAGVCVQ